MSRVDVSKISIKENGSSWLDSKGTPGGVVDCIRFSVLHDNKVIGYFSGYYLNLNQWWAHKPYPFRAIFEAGGDELCDLYRVLYSKIKTGEYKATIESSVSTPVVRDLLFIKEFEVMPEYRGQGVGYAVLDRIHRHDDLGRGTHLIVIKTDASAQSRLYENVTYASPGGSHLRLSRYWHKAGFKQVTGEPFMYYDVGCMPLDDQEIKESFGLA